MQLKIACKHIAFYVTLAVLFGIGVTYFMGAKSGAEFTMAYLIELSLSVDNLMVFALIFTHFAVPDQYQYRVLYWGIVGAVILRLSFIMAGITLVQNLTWVLYIFGAFLIYTGIKLLIVSDEEPSLEENKVMKWCNKHLRITGDYIDKKFWYVSICGNLYFTPLFVVLCMIEISDILFAFDSIPAAFAVTLDPFIIFTANIFAILGLRSMYFVLASMLDRFEYLKYGISMILVGIGAKMILNHYYAYDVISTPVSLAVTGSVLALATIYSMVKTKC